MPELSIKQQREQHRQAKLAARAAGASGRTRQRIWLWGGSLLGIGALVWAIWFFAQPAPTTSNSNTTTLGLQVDDQVRGNREASVVLIEYSDFQCPACKQYEPLVNQVSEKYGDQIALVYRHFPLRSIHKNAEIAARSSEAIAKQGEFFWAYHDLLFDRQSSWSTEGNPQETLAGYAAELGADKTKFLNDLNSTEVKNEVSQDEQRGQSSQVPGTPTFFLNGRLIEANTFADFTRLIDQALTTP